MCIQSLINAIYGIVTINQLGVHHSFVDFISVISQSGNLPQTLPSSPIWIFQLFELQRSLFEQSNMIPFTQQYIRSIVAAKQRRTTQQTFQYTCRQHHLYIGTQFPDGTRCHRYCFDPLDCWDHLKFFGLRIDLRRQYVHG